MSPLALLCVELCTTEDVMQPSQTNDQCFTTEGGLSVTVNDCCTSISDTGFWEDAKRQSSAPNSCRFPQLEGGTTSVGEDAAGEGSNVQAQTVKVTVEVSMSG